MERLLGPTLVKLLIEDRHDVPQTGKQEVRIRCFNPDHDDQNPSMDINVAKGVYTCRSCGISGGVLDYLESFRKVSREEAHAILKKHGHSTESLSYMTHKADTRLRRQKGAPHKTVDTEIPETINRGGKQTHRREGVWDYLNADGSLFCKKARFNVNGRFDRNGKQKKDFYPFTRCKADQKWWWSEPRNAPQEDGSDAKTPLYRLPELLAMLAQYQDGQVLIVEGEKCADRVIQAHQDAGAGVICTTSFARDKSTLPLTDWEPLRNRKVCIIGDTDEAGRSWVERLAPLLSREYGCKVRLLLPHGLGGFDVADAIEGVKDKAGNMLTGKAGMYYWIQEECGGLVDYVDKGDPVPADTTLGDVDLSENEHFKVLGLSEDDERPQVVFTCYPFHHKRYIPLGQLTNIDALSNIAPNDWWEKIAPGTGKGQLRKVKDTIREAAEQIGKVDMSGCLGRGATVDGDSFYFNVGNLLLTEDAEGRLTVEKSFQDVPGIPFETGVPMLMTASKNAEAVSRALYDAMVRYRFRTRNEAHAFLGWIVTALIGGALDFRPHIWISGKTGVGKSFLLSSVLHPVLGDALVRSADPTQAGLCFKLRSDALAVSIDEFEPTQKNRSETEAILHTCRTATSGETQRLRGNPQGRSVPGHVQRFSAAVCSILKPELSDADRSRFQMIGFGPELPKAEWPLVEQAILQAASSANGRILRHHVVTHTRHIVRTLYRLALEEFNQRDYTTRMKKCCGALTAGVRFLSGDNTIVVSPTTEESMKLEGEYGPLVCILNKEISVIENGQQRKRPVSRVLEAAYFDDGAWIDAPEGRNIDHVRTLEDHGIQMEKVGSSFELRLFFTHWTLRTLLRASQYQDTDLKQSLRDMDGVTFPHDRRGQPRRKSCGGQRRPYAAISGTVLENKLGFLFDYSTQEREALDEVAEREHEDVAEQEEPTEYEPADLETQTTNHEGDATP